MTALLLMLSAALAAGPEAGELPPLEGDGFRPVLDSTGTLVVEDSAPVAGFRARADLGYANQPIAWRYDGEEESYRVVGDLWSLHLGASQGLGPVRLGLSAPLYLSAGSDYLPADRVLVGDPRLEGKVTLLDRTDGGLGLAGLAGLSLPMGAWESALGSDGVAGDLGVVVDGDLGKLRLGASLRVGFKPRATLENIDQNEELGLGGGASWALSSRQRLSAELRGRTQLGQLFASEQTPFEAVLGWSHLGESGTLFRGGLGSAVSAGVGQPRFRVLLGIGRAPSL